MIRYSTQVAEPEQIPLSITITMTVDHWRSFLLKVNENSYPANQVGKIISDAIGYHIVRLTSKDGGSV